MSRRICMSTLLFIVFLTGYVAVPLQAQEAVGVTIQEADLSNYPQLSLPVSVLSRSGVPFRNLTNADFEVLEDAKPLTINSVTAQTNSDLSVAIALVLDLSNSSQIDDVKRATHQFLDVLGPNVRVAIIGFNQPLDFSDMDPVKEIGFTSNLDAVRSVVDALPRGGASAVYEAIYKGVLITADEVADRRAVIVMTDGHDTASRSEIAQADTPTRAAKDRGIPIFTIGAYMSGMGQNPNYLNVIARETGGRYKEVVDFERLDDLFEDVLLQLQTEYVLDFRTTLAPDGQGHLVTVRATTVEGVGEGTRTVVYPSRPPVPQILRLQREINNELQDLEAGTSLKGRVLLVPEITAQNPLVRVEYYVNGTLAHTAFVAQAVGNNTYKPWEWSWNTNALEAGTHTVEIIAYDEIGNASQRLGLEVQTEGGSNINPWLILAVVAAIILLLVVLFFILRSSRSQVSVVQRPGNDTVIADGGWTAPTSDPVETPGIPQDPYPQAEPVLTQRMGGSVPKTAGHSLTETISIRRKSEVMGWLIGEKGPVLEREFRLHEVTSIGRLGSNDIVLDDPAVSRNHAKIRLQDHTFVITDLGAANPTLVNGMEIARQELRDGDRVELGSSVLVFKQITPKD